MAMIKVYVYHTTAKFLIQASIAQVPINKSLPYIPIAKARGFMADLGNLFHKRM